MIADWFYIALIPLTLLAAWKRPFLIVSLFVGVAAFVARWIEAGHLPLFGTYESALSLAVFVMGMTIVVERLFAPGLPLSPVIPSVARNLAGRGHEERAFRTVPPPSFLATLGMTGGEGSAESGTGGEGARSGAGARAGALTTPAPLIATLLLLQGLAYDKTAYALTISERSLIVDIHAVLAWAAFATLTANFAIAARIIFKRGVEPSPDCAPSTERCALSTTLTTGFLLYSAMIATGSLYKFMLFGVAWSFDPIETLAVASWLAYGVILHLHLMARWRGRQLAQWCAGVFILLVVSYRAIILFPPSATYHIFDIDKRIHIAQEVPR